MSKPSKLKRAIRKLEEKNEGNILEKIRLDRLINDTNSTIGMLKKIDNEKSNEKEVK